MRLFANPRFRFQAAIAFLSPVLALQAIRVEKASAAPPAVIQSQPVSSGVVCPKCGQIHATRSAVQTVSGSTIQRPQGTVSNVGTRNVLAILNGQRSRQGLRSLRYDAALQAVAERRARQMASTGTKNHPPGSFAPGRYEGVGWSSSYSPNGVHACYTSDPNMSTAGAAMVSGRDGVYFAVVYR